MKFLSRSSRATGPNTRVPIGVPSSLISTAAFWSNLTYVPSARRTSLRVRTITASWTVPFFIVPSGEASLTVTLMRSPRLAIFPVEPPIGMIISTRRAPELSATSREVCIWITVVTSDYCLEAIHRFHRFLLCVICVICGLLRRFLNDLNYTPALARGKWTRFNDSYLVADGRAELVVGHELRRATHVTAVLAMPDQTVYSNHHRLLHTVRRDGPDFLRPVRA